MNEAQQILEGLHEAYTEAVGAGDVCAQIACALFHDWEKAPHEVKKHIQWKKAREQVKRQFQQTALLLRQYFTLIKTEPMQPGQVELRERIKSAYEGCQYCSRGLDMIARNRCIAAQLLREGKEE